MHQDYRQTLRDIFFDRRSKNSSYSLRAFARDLKMPSSNLSLVLKGEKGISQNTAQLLTERLPLSAEEKKIFCKSVENLHAKSAWAREKALEELDSLSALSSNVSLDMMQVLGGWQCFALLALLRISKDHSLAVLSQALEFSEQETAHYLKKLLAVGLIDQLKSKRYRVCNDFSWSADGIPSEIIRKSHDKILDKAKEALSMQSTEERDFTSIMCDIDSTHLPQAKKEIRKFIRSFYLKYSNKKTANHVYALNLQLYNLTPKRNLK
jgi:uncharacterized protein (TIGR02147 family)